MTPKITSVTVEHTRQVQQFNPVRISLTADIREGEDPQVVAKEVQRMVLMLTYKDDAKQRDMLIAGLVDCAPKTTPAVQQQGRMQRKNTDFSEPQF